MLLTLLFTVLLPLDNELLTLGDTRFLESEVANGLGKIDAETNCYGKKNIRLYLFVSLNHTLTVEANSTCGTERIHFAEEKHNQLYPLD